MKYATTLAVLLMVVSAVSAAPTLSWSRTDIGGGLYAYDFAIQNNDGLLASYTATLYFQAGVGSTINQVKLFGGALECNTEPMATTYDGQMGYSKAQDTWAYSPFSENPIPGTSPANGATINGFSEGTGWYQFSLATGAGSALGNNVKVAHLVAGGLAAGTWAGTIARSSVLYQTNGVYPEPATMALLGIGALGLIRRRR